MLFSRHQVAFHLKKKKKTGGIKEGREGWRRSRCGALISSLMDFVSGVSVRNHAFIMGRGGGGGGGGHLLAEILTAQHLKRVERNSLQIYR